MPAVQADESTDLYNDAVKLVNGGGDLQTAINLLDKALTVNSSKFGASSKAFELKSYAQIKLGDYTGALTTINTALSNEETDILWNNKGYILYNLGRFEEAITAYDRAIKITPDYTIALINKGDALMKLAKYQDALDSYTKALASDVQANDLTLIQKARTYNDMGDAYAGLGMYQDAVAAYKASLVNDPGNADTSAALARAQQQVDAGTQLVIVAVIAVVIIGGVAAYYLMQKKTIIPEKKKHEK